MLDMGGIRICFFFYSFSAGAGLKQISSLLGMIPNTSTRNATKLRSEKMIALIKRMHLPERLGADAKKRGSRIRENLRAPCEFVPLFVIIAWTGVGFEGLKSGIASWKDEWR